MYDLKIHIEHEQSDFSFINEVAYPGVIDKTVLCITVKTYQLSFLQNYRHNINVYNLL